MESPKILFVNQEIVPYLKETALGNVARHIPPAVQDKGKEIRSFMPRFGNINERRHQLHEVIRLSGMNIVVNDVDHPLIIKVASIPAARMQIYFIDNDDLFGRKSMFVDKNGKAFTDNDERSIFFVRGVIETLKKLSWTPDIIHCNGWFTSLLPLYLKRVYKDNPLYANAKLVLSLYSDGYKGKLNKDFVKKLKFDGILAKDAEKYSDTSYINFMKAAIDLVDGVIVGDEKVSAELIDHAKKGRKKVLAYQGEENYEEAYNSFYDRVLGLNKK